MSDWHLRLQLKTRATRGVKSNLFARISPRIVKVFSRFLLTLPNPKPSDSGYSILDYLQAGKSDSPVDFLPLEITFSDGTKIYTSYNGGSIDEDDTIELPSSAFPQGYNDQAVNVIPLVFIQDVSELVVLPISTEDWELLELYSSYLESGGILNQVSVVYPGQVLTLCVGDEQNYAQIRINEELEGCRRLLANTQFIVVPKPRPGQFSPSQPFRLLATSEDWSEDMLVLANNWDLKHFSVSPNSMLMNPKTLVTKVPGWKEEIVHAIIWRDDLKVSERSSSLVKIETSHDIDENCIALSITSRYSIKAIPFIHFVQIQLISSEAISRIQSWTNEQIEQNEVVLTIDRMKAVIKEETTWKLWRHNESCCGYPKPPVLEILNKPYKGEILLTDESFVILPDFKSLFRIRFKRSNYQVGETAEWYPVPEFIISMRDIRKNCVIDTFDKIYDNNDIGLTLMPSTSHVGRQSENIIEKSMKVKWDCNDAWIVEGEPGSGKTHLCLVFAGIARMRWFMPTFYLDCKLLQTAPDLKMHSTLSELTSTFKEAIAAKPSILVLDDLDHLVPNFSIDSSVTDTDIRQENPIAMDQSKLLANHLQYLLESCQSRPILVVSCKKSSSINAEVLESLTSYESCTIEALSQDERGKLIHNMVEKDCKIPPYLMSLQSEGYRAHDLSVLVTRAQTRFPKDEADAKQMLTNIVDNYVPISRQGLLSNANSDTQEWSDVGGIFDAKRKIKSIVLDPMKYRRIYENSPINLPNGILLCGPPGCGKSFLVPALARKCKHTLITCRGPELLDRYIGASEANVRKLFEQARCAAPSILFLDEFDSLAPRRGSDHTGVTDRVVNQLLTFLDGVETSLKDVFIIAATSRPDKVDPALLRPGRLEQHIYIGFPESPSEITDVVMKMIAKRQVSNDLMQAVESGSLCKTSEEVKHLGLLSPADIRAVLDTAHLEAINELIEIDCLDQTGVTVCLQHFRMALLVTCPSLSQQDRAMFDRVNAQFMPPLINNRSDDKKKPVPPEQKISLK